MCRFTCSQFFKLALDARQSIVQLARRECRTGLTRQAWVVLPPVHPDLLGLIDGAHEQTNLDREQLNVGEVDLDVAGNDQPFVEHPVEDLDQTGAAGRRNEVWQGIFLTEAAQRAKVNLKVCVRQTEDAFQVLHSTI